MIVESSVAELEAMQQCKEPGCTLPATPEGEPFSMLGTDMPVGRMREYVFRSWRCAAGHRYMQEVGREQPRA